MVRPAAFQKRGDLWKGLLDLNFEGLRLDGLELHRGDGENTIDIGGRDVVLVHISKVEFAGSLAAETLTADQLELFILGRNGFDRDGEITIFVIDVDVFFFEPRKLNVQAIGFFGFVDIGLQRKITNIRGVLSEEGFEERVEVGFIVTAVIDHGFYSFAILLF